MRSATVTSKGQVTIPKEIRDLLRVKAGDLLDFVVDSKGKVEIRPGTLQLSDLKGLLHRPGRRPVTIEEMEKAILGHRKVLAGSKRRGRRG
jgi:antitoxin PrlF